MRNPELSCRHFPDNLVDCRVLPARATGCWSVVRGEKWVTAACRNTQFLHPDNLSISGQAPVHNRTTPSPYSGQRIAGEPELAAEMVWSAVEAPR